jgi:hypothetical protein
MWAHRKPKCRCRICAYINRRFGREMFYDRARIEKNLNNENLAMIFFNIRYKVMRRQRHGGWRFNKACNKTWG